MSIAVQEITRSVVAVVANDLKNKMTETIQQALAANPDSLNQLLPLIMAWYDQAVQKLGAGIANLTVPVVGGGGGGGNYGMPAVSASLNIPTNNAFGLPPAGGVAPAPFPSASLTPQAGPGFGGGVPMGLPPKTAATLQACGLARVPTTHSSQGAVCGVQHNVKSYGSPVFCCDAATKANAKTNTWTCGKHVNRDTLDLQKGGKKTSGNGAVVSAQQGFGLKTPIGMPQGFGANPALAGQLAGAMAQQPTAPGFPPQQFGFPGAAPFPPQQQQPGFPPQQGVQQQQQLMGTVQNQLGQIPQQQPVFPGGAGINMSNLMAQQPATAVPTGVAPFQIPTFGAAPPQQIQPQVTQAVSGGGSDDSDSDDESTDEEHKDTPIDRSAAAQAAALAGVANQSPTPFQQPQLQLPFQQQPQLQQPQQQQQPQLPFQMPGGFSLPGTQPQQQQAPQQQPQLPSNPILAGAFAQGQAAPTPSPFTGMPIPMQTAPVDLTSVLNQAAGPK